MTKGLTKRSGPEVADAAAETGEVRRSEEVVVFERGFEPELSFERR